MSKGGWANLKDFAELLKIADIKGEDFVNEVIINKIRNNWEDIAGPILSKQSYIIGIYGFELKISTTHPAYKQEFIFHEKNILNQLSLKIPEAGIRKLKVVEKGKKKYSSGY